MAAPIGALRAELSASIAKFNADMGRAASTVRGFAAGAEAQSRRVEAAGARMANIGKTIGASLGRALSVVAIVAVGTALVRMGDQLQDVSDQLNVTTQFLQGVRAAALSTGAGTESLNKGLAVFVDNLGDAEKGTGNLAKLMRAHSIQLGTTEQAFFDVADAVKNAATWQEKMAIATAAFGRSGREMVPLLNQGAAGLKAMFEQAARDGQIWDDKTIKALDRASDAFERLRVILAGRLADPFAVFLESLNDLVGSRSWSEFWAKMGDPRNYPGFQPSLNPTFAGGQFGTTAGLRRGFAQGTVAGVVGSGASANLAPRTNVPMDPSGAKAAASAMAAAIKQARSLATAVIGVRAEIDRFAKGSLSELAEKLRGIDDTYNSLHAKIEQQIEDNAALASKNDSAARSVAQLRAMLLDLEKAHIAATAAARAQFAAEEGLAALQSRAANLETRQSIEDLQRGVGIGAPISSAAAELQTIQRGLDTQRMQAAIKLQELENQRAEAQRKNIDGAAAAEIARLDSEIMLQQQLYALVQRTTADQLQAAMRITSAFQNLTDQVASNVSDMLVNWKFDIESLKSIFRDFIRDLLIKPAVQQGTDLLGSVLKSVLGFSDSGGGAGAASAVQSFAGGFAAGGFVPPNQWGIAGEDGPEPVFGGRTGMSVQAMGTPGGDRRGGGDTNVFDMRGATVESVARLERFLNTYVRTERGRFRIHFAELAGALPR